MFFEWPFFTLKAHKRNRTSNTFINFNNVLPRLFVNFSNVLLRFFQAANFFWKNFLRLFMTQFHIFMWFPLVFRWWIMTNQSSSSVSGETATWQQQQKQHPSGTLIIDHHKSPFGNSNFEFSSIKIDDAPVPSPTYGYSLSKVRESAMIIERKVPSFSTMWGNHSKMGFRCRQRSRLHRYTR